MAALLVDLISCTDQCVVEAVRYLQQGGRPPEGLYRDSYLADEFLLVKPAQAAGQTTLWLRFHTNNVNRALAAAALLRVHGSCPDCVELRGHFQLRPSPVISGRLAARSRSRSRQAAVPPPSPHTPEDTEYALEL